MASYSIDLRQKILHACERRLGSQQAIANIFDVSLSFVEKLLRRHRTTGDIAPKPHGGGQRPRLDAAAFTQSHQEFQRAASQREPSSRVRGILTDGFDSTTSRMRALFPGARLGHCLRHAITKLPGKLTAIASPVR